MEFYAKYKMSNNTPDIAAKISGALKNYNIQSNGITLFISAENGDHEKLFLINGMEKWGGPLKLNYDFPGAIKAGIKEHPQHCIEQMGFTVLGYDSEDGAEFATIDVFGDDITLPDYITILPE